MSLAYCVHHLTEHGFDLGLIQTLLLFIQFLVQCFGCLLDPWIDGVLDSFIKVAKLLFEVLGDLSDVLFDLGFKDGIETVEALVHLGQDGVVAACPLSDLLVDEGASEGLQRLKLLRDVLVEQRLV